MWGLQPEEDWLKFNKENKVETWFAFTVSFFWLVNNEDPYDDLSSQITDMNSYRLALKAEASNHTTFLL